MSKRAIHSFLTLTAMAWLAQPVQAGTARPGLAGPDARQPIRAEARENSPVYDRSGNRPAGGTD